MFFYVITLLFFFIKGPLVVEIRQYVFYNDNYLTLTGFMGEPELCRDELHSHTLKRSSTTLIISTTVTTTITILTIIALKTIECLLTIKQ